MRILLIIAALLALYLMSDLANADELLIHDLGNGFTMVDTGSDVILCTRIGSYIVCN